MTLFDQAHRARMVTLRLRQVPRESTREHHAVLDAIKAGDAALTRRLFKRHRQRAAKELLALLENLRLTHL